MSAGTNYVIERLGLELAKADQNIQTLLEHKRNVEDQVQSKQAEIDMLRSQLDQRQAALPADLPFEPAEGSYDSGEVSPDLEA